MDAISANATVLLGTHSAIASIKITILIAIGGSEA
jgi:hypothetical protein